MKMNTRVMHWVVAVAATGLIAAGCGSDSKSSSPATGGAASSEAKAWCDDLLGVAGKVATAYSDPSKAKDLQSLSADAARLTSEGESIATKHTADAGYVANCETQAGALVSGSGAPSSTTASDGTVTDDTTASDDTTAPDDTTASGGTVGSGTATVADAKAWCKKIEDLADIIKQIKADPSKAVELGQKMADATKFLEDGTRIASASEANAKIISDCSDKVSKEIDGS
jgi:hypothetical protein